mgnify:CR=1 FL=1
MIDDSTYRTLISAANLQALIKLGGCLIVDCRFDLSDTEKKRSEYLQSHIPGAYYAHLDEQLSSPILPDTGRHPMPDVAKLTSWLAGCGFDGSQQVVVYDDSFGAMASRLWWLLKCLGHESVAVLDGGWQAWLAAGFQTDAQLPQSDPIEYTASLDSNCVVNSVQIMSALKAGDSSPLQLVDVRSNERFIGAAEPIDPIAGHVPGAINMPLTDNLDEQGCYRSPQQLQEMYRPLLQQHSAHELAFMCGSGVTACHSVLAMVHAGYDMPRVYAGSWSEWIRDCNRPRATGE